MMGPGLEPKSYHPIVDMMSDQELQKFMQIQRHKVDAVLRQLPTHQEFINRYCSAASA
jgi:tryptophan halogenase